MDEKIKLSRKHYSLPNTWIINNQTQYETSQFLMEQERLGFNPSHFITFHYYHPDEKDFSHLRYNDKTTKKRFYNSLWREKPKHNFIRKRRLNEFSVVEDTSQIKNVVLKELYGVKRLDKKSKYEIPNLIFFHEKGKSQVKYHTHLLLSHTKYFKSGKWRKHPSQSLEYVFNNRIREKRKCFSNWKNIHIEEVYDVRGALSYCNKETNSSNISIDFQNSNLITR